MELTLYDDYAIVGVPVTGKARRQGWLYRTGSGPTFGGVRAVFPGAQPVDTSRLDVPALVRNIAGPKSSLNVEKPQGLRGRAVHPAGRTTAPRVDVHVSNEFGESGYLATTLAGQGRAGLPLRLAPDQ